MIYGKCAQCKKNKFFIRKRTFFNEKLNTQLTSKSQICGKCFRAVKKLKI